MPYWHAYVDESGDRGWKRRPADLPPGARAGSSEHFCLTAVLVPEGAQSVILETWGQMATEIGRKPSDTIHWTSVRSHPQRLHLCNGVNAVEDLRVISVVFSKWDVDNARTVRAPDDLYTWTLRLLVERLSWFGKRHQAQTVMHFAQVKGLPPRLIADYLSGLQRQATNIEWGHLVMPAKVDTPRNQRMLQIADTASGAVYAAFEWTTTATLSVATSTRCTRTFGDQPVGLCRRTGSRSAHGLTRATRGRRRSADGRQREGARDVGRVAAVSLSPATDGVPEPTLIIPDPARNATGAAECHPPGRCPPPGWRACAR